MSDATNETDETDGYICPLGPMRPMSPMKRHSAAGDASGSSTGAVTPCSGSNIALRPPILREQILQSSSRDRRLRMGQHLSAC